MHLQCGPEKAIRDFVLRTDSARVHFTGHCLLHGMQELHGKVLTHCRLTLGRRASIGPGSCLAALLAHLLQLSTGRQPLRNTAADLWKPPESSPWHALLCSPAPSAAAKAAAHLNCHHALLNSQQELIKVYICCEYHHRAAEADLADCKVACLLPRKDLHANTAASSTCQSYMC